MKKLLFKAFFHFFSQICYTTTQSGLCPRCHQIAFFKVTWPHPLLNSQLPFYFTISSIWQRLWLLFNITPRHGTLHFFWFSFYLVLTLSQCFVLIFPPFPNQLTFPWSILRSFLFLHSQSSLGDLIQYFAFNYHPYGNDSEIYISSENLSPELQTKLPNFLLNSSTLMSNICFNMSKLNFWYPPSSYQSYLSHSHNADWQPLLLSGSSGKIVQSSWFFSCPICEQILLILYSK